MRASTIIDGVEYAPGKRFRVTREGARLVGMVSTRPFSAQGWSQALPVGTVITCTGFGPGWGSDPGFGVGWTSGEAARSSAFSLEFRPGAGGIWNQHPAPGYLEEEEG